MSSDSIAKKILMVLGVVASIAAVGYGGMLIYKKVAARKPAGCKTTAECPAGQKCMNAKCVSGCSATLDCPTGYVCLEGKCSKPENLGTCSINSDCSLGYGCSPDKECVASGAVDCVGSGENCPSGWGCYAGVCKPGCDEDIECAENQTCSAGQCNTIPQ